MSDYTPGRLRAGEKDSLDRAFVRAEDIDGQPYVAVCPPALVGDHKANAIRLAACWNFCAGTATEYLDGAGNLGRLLATAGAGVNAELLAAVEVLLNDVNSYLSRGGKLTDTEAAHVRQMRAAVARARGEAPSA